tara:strand:+ start:134 stop:814 length:681 start_codon:yes stop_codon:yes gene_type:complete
MKRYFYNFYLIIRNINNYGLFTIIKAFIVELFYLLKIRDFNSYIHDDEATSSYEDTKDNKEYNTQHTPTPYYFLTFVKKFIQKNNIDNFVLVDLGCGYGRVGKYFMHQFNCIFYGLEINPKFLTNLIIEKKDDNNFNLQVVNLKDKNLREKIFNEIIAHNKKIILFISDPFDIKTILEIMKYFQNTSHYIVAINIKDYRELLTAYNKLDIKVFNIDTRHIMLLAPK